MVQAAERIECVRVGGWRRLTAVIDEGNKIR